MSAEAARGQAASAASGLFGQDLKQGALEDC